MEEYYQEHDKPNLLYMLIGSQIHKLAGLGATDEELHIFLVKGGDVTLHDVAVIEAKHLKPKAKEFTFNCGGAVFSDEDEDADKEE